MKISQIEPRVQLVEGLGYEASRTYRLWESTGHVLKEFALDDTQIKQLFAQIEKDLSAPGGNNRTAIGKGIDTATAAGKEVKKAYDELVNKVQTSAPMENADAMYDTVADKLKTATGGDAGVMKYVQKYRDFAKAHPVAQSFIYAALIAAAGISGAGLGGAAALGLFKMTDRLLQGDKFSTALGKGAMTGATTLAAGQVGQALQGADAVAPAGAEGPANIGNQSFAAPPPPGTDAIDAAAQTAVDAGKEGAKSAASTAATNRIAGTAVDTATTVAQGAGAEMFQGLATDSLANDAIKQIADKIAAGTITDRDLTFLDSTKQFVAAQINDQGYQTAPKELWDHYNVLDAMVRKAVELPKLKESFNPFINYVTTQAAWQLNESLGRPRGGVYLTEAGIKQALQTAASNIGTGIKTAATNLTTKVTADKLQKAWAKSGNPPDSVALEKFLQQQGVDAGTIAKSMQAIGLEASGVSANQKVEPNMSGDIPAPGATSDRVEPTLAEPAAQAPAATTTPEPAPEVPAATTTPEPPKTPEQIRKEKQAAAAADAQAQMKANPPAATKQSFGYGQQVTIPGTQAPALPKAPEVAAAAKAYANLPKEEKDAIIAKLKAALGQQTAPAAAPEVAAESFRRLNKIIK